MEKDAGKEVKGQKEEMAKGNGRPTERPRFMFNIADGGFTGRNEFTAQVAYPRLLILNLLQQYKSC